MSTVRPTTVTCNLCKGTGLANGTTAVCARCRGAGYLILVCND